MSELRTLLERQAAQSRPAPDLDDVLQRARSRRRRRSTTRLALFGLMVLAVVASGLWLRRGDGQDVGTRPPPDTVAAVVASVPVLGGTLERFDSTAARGPWSVIVRPEDGAFGQHSAVITFPVTHQMSDPNVRVGTIAGELRGGTLWWRLGDGVARLQSDLPEVAMVKIADAVKLADEHPIIDPPKGFSVVASVPSRPERIREFRTGSTDVGEEAALGAGLTYVGVMEGAGFEDALLAQGAAEQLGIIDGSPAWLSEINGGNGTLAWELRPGVVAYVGWSGSSMTSAAGPALLRIAQRLTWLDAAAWMATGPQVVEQRNDIS